MPEFPEHRSFESGSQEEKETLPPLALEFFFGAHGTEEDMHNLCEKFEACDVNKWILEILCFPYGNIKEGVWIRAYPAILHCDKTGKKVK